MKERILVYVLRRDLRLADNPIINEIAKLTQQSQRPFTHFLPVYIFPANQIEVSGFVSSPAGRSPYPEARGNVSGFWRCGRKRSQFIAESVWDLKKDLQNLKSDLVVRVGTVKDAVSTLLEGFSASKDEREVSAVWMTSEEGVEEKREERDVDKLCDKYSIPLKLWADEKYFIDDRDLPLKNASELSDVFTSFRKTVEPLRDAPRKTLPAPEALPPLPSKIPAQAEPFAIPEDFDSLLSALHAPLGPTMQLPSAPEWPEGAKSAHPFKGGSKEGQARIKHLITSGSMTNYKDTRNEMLGTDFSTKLSAWLALGSITARQIHWALIDFENGATDVGKGTQGYGKGENKGTAAVRFELLWRDYMRLCTRKFGPRLFRVEGFRNDTKASWKYPSASRLRSDTSSRRGGDNNSLEHLVQRFLNGTTGTGLIDASQRELYLTGYTSNRARQNVASFLAKHLGVDWRVGAEWYECCLVDYDVSSNWGNWQYVAGVGNDPRGEQRVFNPVKQALDYDPRGEYVATWVPQLRDVGRQGEELMGVFQAWRLGEDRRRELSLEGLEWVEQPLKRIDFQLNRYRGGGGGGGGRRGGGSGGRGGGRRGGGGGGGGRGGRGRGDGGGREARRGQMGI